MTVVVAVVVMVMMVHNLEDGANGVKADVDGELDLA